MSKYRIIDKTLVGLDKSHLYYHTNTETGVVTIIYAYEDLPLGQTLTEAEAEAIIASNPVESTVDMGVTSHIPHRFAHHFNQPQGQYSCYTSNLNDSDITLFYILEHSTGVSRFFKKDTANPAGVTISSEVATQLIQEHPLGGIYEIGANEMLRKFGHLLGDLT